MNEKLKKRLQEMITEYKKVSKADLSDGQKYFYEYTEQAFNAVLNIDEWIQKSPEEKQSYRIFQVEKMRSRNEDVTKNLLEIELYAKVKEVIPYAMASSYVINNQKKHLTQDLIEFCERQLEIIDENKKVMELPNKLDLEKAFECYFNHIKPDRIPSLKSYKQPEVQNKIGELYNLFERIITTYNNGYN
ncbi:hypothetical protein [Arenibacter echinorum]|nr:hypothetical protein [Arenibacter echinorum]